MLTPNKTGHSATATPVVKLLRTKEPAADGAQARAKAVWGSIEDAGRMLREKAATSAVAQTGAEKAGERRGAAQRAS